MDTPELSLLQCVCVCAIHTCPQLKVILVTVNVFLALICEVVIPLLVYIICCYNYTLSVALLAACLRGTLNWGRVGLHGGLKSWGVRIQGEL